ncbi:hypothetical protein ACFV1W_29770 [Kitasatospora sp. NPDC059648]
MALEADDGDQQNGQNPEHPVNASGKIRHGEFLFLSGRYVRSSL